MGRCLLFDSVLFAGFCITFDPMSQGWGVVPQHQENLYINERQEPSATCLAHACSAHGLFNENTEYFCSSANQWVQRVETHISMILV